MIKRYAREKMTAIWTAENKFQKWLDVEIAACEAHHQLGNINKQDLDTIKEKARFDVQRIDEIEAEIHHDVIAFLTNVAENVGPESRLIHLGLTSSDVVDTAFSLLIKESGHVLIDAIDELLQAIETQAYKYKNTLMMGRTHGVHAEPTTLGLKLTVWYDEIERSKERLLSAINGINVGKISGAVGNYAHISPKIEEFTCQKLGLRPAKASTQILQRDRHAHFMTSIAIIGGSLEKMATEIRSLQKTECNEILEPFSKKQKGSSAMPHKKNPIICERITGLARTLRGYALSSLENQALWHERDISHSSTERIIFPDATVGLDYMIGLMIKVLNGMVVNEAQMQDNIDKSYQVFFSQQVLLKMIDKGMLREDAYRIVQRNAHQAFDEKVPLLNKLKEDTDISTLIDKDELEGIFNYSHYTRQIDTIFDRVY
ncbi:MAG: adenylosuccinate lyase [Actinobacteria bacterium]|nr:adenylosuccinate lyase [Actinomycetota bacterium]